MSIKNIFKTLLIVWIIAVVSIFFGLTMLESSLERGQEESMTLAEKSMTTYVKTFHKGEEVNWDRLVCSGHVLSIKDHVCSVPFIPNGDETAELQFIWAECPAGVFSFGNNNCHPIVSRLR